MYRLRWDFILENKRTESKCYYNTYTHLCVYNLSYILIEHTDLQCLSLITGRAPEVRFSWGLSCLCGLYVKVRRGGTLVNLDTTPQVD